MVADSSPHRHYALMPQAIRALLDPKAIAVVGASQQPGRGTSVVVNLRDAGFGGEIFAVNPRYTDVLGYRCYPSVNELPDTGGLSLLFIRPSCLLPR